MKKGFTLVELLAVIAILAVISVITFPVVNNLIKGANQHAYDDNIEVIKKAAYDWTLLNTSLLPENDNESIVVYLGELKLSGSIDKNIKNPLTGKFLSNNTSVVVTKNGNEYVYEVNIVDLNGSSNEKTPLLVISGNIVDYVEVTQGNVTYTIPSAVAKTSDGYPISSSYISYQIFKDDSEVSSVDVSSLGIYTIKYSVTYDGETGMYEKKVIVRDTTKPVLNIGDSIFASIDALPSNEDLLTDVTVTDNSGEEIVPTLNSEIENREGVYYVYYTAKDSSNNEVTKRREVNVYDSSSNEHSVLLGTNWTFEYNGTDGIDGSVQTFTVPENGKYKLEVWGAQGGMSLCNDSAGASGGKGGYSTGEITLHNGSKLYIVVGGKGVNAVKGSDAHGGYNGGGSGTWDHADNEAAGGGGGATHIALNNNLGELKNYSDSKNSILIVAGGGGGASWNTSGGVGGGLTAGSSGGDLVASSTAGYAFGQGQNATGTGDSDGHGGGGGGYYGGYESNTDGEFSDYGGGGAGYLGSISNASSIAGNESMPSHDGTTTMTGNSDHGYAKITLISY